MPDIAAACLVVISLVLSMVIVGLNIIGVSHAMRRYEDSMLRSIDVLKPDWLPVTVIRMAYPRARLRPSV